MSQRLRLLHLVKYVCLCAHIHVTTRTAGMHIPVYTYRASSVSMPTTACVCMCTHPREHAGLARNMYTHVSTCVHIQVSMCRHPRAHVRSWDHLRFHLPSLAYFSNGQIIPQAIPRLYNVVLIACTPEILLLRSTLGHFPGVTIVRLHSHRSRVSGGKLLNPELLLLGVSNPAGVILKQ